MNFNIPCRLWPVLAAVLLAPSASANGAMGLGLEMFDLNYWFAYVVVTIGLEAWLIGRYVKATTFASITVAIIANLLTGVMCGGLGCIAPFLHYPIIGSFADPKPFPNAVALLTIFAVPSAFLEMILWERACLEKNKFRNYRHILLVHLATIPVGLAILLIPERPYIGLERMTMGNRRITTVMEARRALETYVALRGHLPVGKTPKEITAELSSVNSTREDSSGHLALSLWYEPQFSRFSFGETVNHPFEVNQHLVGLSIANIEGREEQWIWYVRHRSLSGHAFGLKVEVNYGQVAQSFDAKDLGY